jgi:hypothetical protein
MSTQPVKPEVISPAPPSVAMQVNEKPARPARRGRAIAQTATPMDLVRIALERGVDIDTLTKVMALQERFEQNEARKAYNAAIATFKENPPEIVKNAQATFEGKNNSSVTYDWATLDQVCAAIVSGLAKVGITHSWKTDQTQSGGWIKVTCILTHTRGHSDETSLLGQPDNTGSKNALQAIGSTVSYLERYTLLALAGMAVRGQDNDGRQAVIEAGANGAAGALTWEDNCKKLAAATTEAELRGHFGEFYRAASAARDKAAQAAYISAKMARLKQLKAGAQ